MYKVLFMEQRCGYFISSGSVRTQSEKLDKAVSNIIQKLCYTTSLTNGHSVQYKTLLIEGVFIPVTVLPYPSPL